MGEKGCMSIEHWFEPMFPHFVSCIPPKVCVTHCRFGPPGVISQRFLKDLSGCILFDGATDYKMREKFGMELHNECQCMLCWCAVTSVPRGPVAPFVDPPVDIRSASNLVADIEGGT
jgi:hypothetical protein